MVLNAKTKVYSVDKLPTASYSGVYSPGYSSGYDMGSHSGGAKWSGGLSGDGAGHTIDHYRTRQNSRKAYHDSLQARGIIDRFVDTIVHTGMRVECEPIADILGITQEEAEQWAKSTERRFHLWANSKEQHRKKQYNFNQAQRLYSKQIWRDGEVFTRLFYSSKKELINPLQFDFLEQNQVRGSAFTSTYLQYNQNDGINKNPDGSAKSYEVWVLKQISEKKGSEYVARTIPVRGAKSNKLMMMHGFTAEYAGQDRGYAKISHILQEVQNVTDFTLAEIKKAINQSNLVVAVENESQDPSNPLEDILTQGGAGPVGDSYAELNDPENAGSGSTCPVNYVPMPPEATFRAPGSGGIFNLQQGDKIKMLGNNAPATGFDAFMDSFNGYMSASVGMPIEAYLMKFGSNFSASRASLKLLWDKAEIERYEMTTDFNQVMFTQWLSEEIAAGRIVAKGWSNSVLRAAWLNSTWIGNPAPDIDPLKTAKADETYVKMGAQTLDMVSQKYNGSDGTSNRAKLKREYSELDLYPYENAAQMENNNNNNNSENMEDDE